MANPPKDRIKVRHESSSTDGMNHTFSIVQSAESSAVDGIVIVDISKGDPHADFVPGAEYVVAFTRA